MGWDLIDNVFVQKLIIVGVSTILPLIPSYLLFRFLPSSSVVSGPFKGFKVNFSGATALYFVIFISLLTTSQFWELPTAQVEIPENYQVWKVEGKLSAENIENYEESFFRIMVDPENYDISKDGEFSVVILRKKSLTTGDMEFPKLYVESVKGRFKTIPIKLDTTNHYLGEIKYKIVQDDTRKKITILDSIILFPNEDIDNPPPDLAIDNAGVLVTTPVSEN